MKFIKLHSAETGKPVQVNIDKVMYIREAPDYMSEDYKNARAWIWLERMDLLVIETPDEIVAKGKMA